MAAFTWRKALTGIALVIAILQIVDAFLIEFPFTAIVSATLLVVGALWLQRPGRGPLILIGLLSSIEIVLVILFGIFGGAASPVETTVAILLGVTSTLGLVASVGALRSSRTVPAEP